MRVCLISEARSYHTQRWTTALAREGCEVHLISAYDVDIPKVILHRLQIYTPNPLKQLMNNTRVRKVIRELEPQVVHLFGLFSLSSLGTMVLIRGLKNLVISVWGSDVVPGGDRETFKESLIKKYLLNRADRIVVSSEYLAREAVKYLRWPLDIDVVLWGVDLTVFPFVDRKKKGEVVTLGFAKRLHPLSGPDILLKSFKYAHDRCNMKLLLKIAGDGPMEAQLRQDAVQMGLSDSIEWVGWLENTEALNNFYRSIDLFVMPSRRESLGVSAIEASASGLPVVASRFGGIPEIVIHGQTGLLVDPEDIEGFGEAIISLAEDEDLRMEMGRRGRRIVEERFDWRSSVSRMIEIYGQVAKSP
ncbi:MAG: glycosyltransferase family 4 protein [Deltaproteobacteria bacterium]|nr:glycosyltransferase family 4 protein [Deltaproteobacteria bacterium]